MDAIVALIVTVVIGVLGVVSRSSERAEARQQADSILRTRARREAKGSELTLERRKRLQEYVRIAAQVISVDQLSRAPIEAIPDPSGRRLDYLKRCLLLAVGRFGIAIPKLKVRFAVLGGTHAGSVHVAKDGSWAVDVDPRYQEDLEALLSIAAHEVSHVALLHRQIALPDKQANEELTDAATVLAGFGPVMLRTAHREAVSEVGDALQIESQRLGYLSVRDLVYLSSLRIEMAGGHAELYWKQVADWQRDAVEDYVEYRQQWAEAYNRRRGEAVPCFGCGVMMGLPTARARIRVTCRVCRYRIELPDVAAT